MTNLEIGIKIKCMNNPEHCDAEIECKVWNKKDFGIRIEAKPSWYKGGWYAGFHCPKCGFYWRVGNYCNTKLEAQKDVENFNERLKKQSREDLSSPGNLEL